MLINGKDEIYLGDNKSGNIFKTNILIKEPNFFVNKGAFLNVFNAHTQSLPGPGSKKIGVRPVTVNCVAFNSYNLLESKKTPGDCPRLHLKTFEKTKSLRLRHTAAIVDQRGYLFAFDFGSNRFWLVARIGVSATCVQFLNDRPREVLVGLSDGSLQCFNIASSLLVAKVPSFHKSAPLGISAHPFLPLALTYCSSVPILWNTAKWERKSVLLGAGDVARVQQAVFSPNGRQIIATFSDGTMFIWHTESCELEWKLTLHVPLDESVFRFNYFAVNSDSTLVAFAGAANASIYVWNLAEKKLVHEIVVPSFKQNCTVSQIHFIGATSALCVTCNTGETVLLDAFEAKYLGQLRHQGARFTALSRDGALLALVDSDARSHVVFLPVNELVDDLVPLTDSMGRINDAYEALSPNRASSPARPKSLRFEAKAVDLESKEIDRKTLYEIVEEKQGRLSLIGPRLGKFLAHFKSYPVEYRTLIWRFLLRIPENREAYESLMGRGIHPCLKNFRKSYPLKSERLLKSMERILSGLAYWSPVFEQVAYLPQLVFPFVKLFVSNQFSGFEVIMTVLLNWCQKWWEYFPNPPLEVLDIVEDMLTFHDPALMQHLLDNKITSAVYAWTPLQTFFSEQLPAQDWLVFADHVVTKRFGKAGGPGYLYGVTAAYLIYHRKALLGITKEDDFNFFFSQPVPTNIHKVLELASSLLQKTPAKLDPSTFLSPFAPLMRNDYPVFNAYPKHIVNFNNKLRQRIQLDEAAYLLKKSLSTNLGALEKELFPEPVVSFDELREWYEQVYRSATQSNPPTAGGQAAEAALEAEWLQKRDELLSARNHLRQLEKKRLDNVLLSKDALLDFGKSRLIEKGEKIRISNGKLGSQTVDS